MMMPKDKEYTIPGTKENKTEEQERLLVQNNLDTNDTTVPIKQQIKTFSRNDSNLSRARYRENNMSGADKKKNRRGGKKFMATAQNSEEEAKLLSEIEEGVFSDSSSEAGVAGEKRKTHRLKRLKPHQNNFKRKTSHIKNFISCLVIVGICILLLLTCKLILRHKNAQPLKTLRSNGTALFAPTTILISLDGFRPDFLDRGITPRLNAMRKEGFSPAYMNPSFPSVTFPNHYTLVTGLYPESHGVVSNIFWDDELKDQFYYTKPEAMSSKWWGGEPIWVTAEKQGIKTAVHMWPGSEAHIMGIEPSYLDKFNYKTTLKEKSRRVLELLDKGSPQDEDKRPQLIAFYAPHVDIDGHYYGPNTTEIRSTISDADQMLNDIYLGLEQRNLTDIVNVVVVSDHGMATTDINRMIQLDDILDLGKIDHIDGWPLSGLHPKSHVDVDELFQELSQKAALNPNYDIYLRDKTMPQRYHFSNNKRIAPIWIVPKTGWAIPSKEEFDIKESKQKGLQYHPRGLHGYDHEHPLMRSIFVARGPAFPQTPSNRIKPFQNTEVYGIICYTLGIKPAPNNGTLHIPLLPIEEQEPDLVFEAPDDPEIGLASTSSDYYDDITTPSQVSSSPALPKSSEIETGFNASETSNITNIYFGWVTSGQGALWEWLEGKSAQIKEWWQNPFS